MPGNACFPPQTSNFSAPLGAVQSGRLVFASYISQVYLRASRAETSLYSARFKHPVPSIWLQEGSLTIQYHHLPSSGHLASSSKPLADIHLNSSIPWEIEFHNGVTHLDAELNGLQLRSLDILGGASHLHLVLSEPPRTTFIYISGGVSHGVIHRPSGVGLSLQVNGGTNRLLFDGRHINAIDREMSLESTNFKSTPGRYDVSIIGGASHLAIDER